MNPTAALCLSILDMVEQFFDEEGVPLSPEQAAAFERARSAGRRMAETAVAS